MKKRFAIVLLGLSILAAGCGGSISSKTEQPDAEQSQMAQDSDTTDQSMMQEPAEEPQAGEEPATTETLPEGSSDSENAAAVTDGETAPEEQSTQPEAAEEQSEAVVPVEGQEDVMQAILMAMPGTAGSSLKAVSAAVNLLDWSLGTAANASKEQIAANAKEWASQQAANGITKEELIEALDSVQAEAVLIQTDPEGVASELEDAGVELTQSDYSAADIGGICSALREGIQAGN